MPAGETALGTLFRRTLVGKRVGVACLGARQPCDIAVGQAVGPEWAAAIAQTQIDLCHQIETVVTVWRVFDPRLEPLPQGEGIVAARQGLGKTAGVGKGEIEADEQAAILRQLRFDQRGDPSFCLGPVAQIDGRVRDASP